MAWSLGIARASFQYLFFTTTNHQWPFEVFENGPRIYIMTKAIIATTENQTEHQWRINVPFHGQLLQRFIMWYKLFALCAEKTFHLSLL